MSEVSDTPAGAADAFVDHALTLAWDAIPEGARAAARTFLHDTLCVGVSGSVAPNADAILAVAKSWGQGGACSVLGRPDVRLPAASAAYVNAFQIHCQEFDCVHEPAVLHPLATVLGALRAEAERSGPYDGPAFLTAMIVGVDVAVALGLAPTEPLRFFRPATAGVFGSVAALARLRGLDRATTLDAFGHALGQASGTMQAHVEGKPALPVQVANAARAAIVAVDLAVAGVKGPQRSIDGPFGYLTLFEGGVALAPILRDLPGIRRIAEVSWKPFPTGRAAHGGLVALQALMAQGLTAANLERLDFVAPPLIQRLVGRPARVGMDVAYARLCLPWLGAVALTFGEIRLGNFSPDRLADPGLLVVAERITVSAEGTDPAAFTPLHASALTVDGRKLETRVLDMLGSPANPLSHAQHMQKALRCLTRAGLQAEHERLAEAIAALDTTPDVALSLRI